MENKLVIARIVGLFIVLINTVLAIFNIPFIIPTEYNEAIASTIIIGYSLYLAVKNDFFGKKKPKEIEEKKS